MSQCRRILLNVLISDFGRGLLPKFHQSFLVYSYISGKIFMEIRSVVFVFLCEVAETDAG